MMCRAILHTLCGCSQWLEVPCPAPPAIQRFLARELSPSCFPSSGMHTAIDKAVSVRVFEKREMELVDGNPVAHYYEK